MIRKADEILKIKFLMNMFEGMVINPISGETTPDGVKQFKIVLDNMIAQGQISNDIANIVKKVYGVENTNTFKPSIQFEKVGQIKNLMGYIENSMNSTNEATIKSNIQSMIANKLVSSTAGEAVLNIFIAEPTIKSTFTTQRKEYNIDKESTNAPIINSTHISGRIKHLIKGKELTRNELTKLSHDELSELLEYYKLLLDICNKRDKPEGLCEAFKYEAYIQKTLRSKDPCFGDRVEYIPFSDRLNKHSKIVYKTDCSDECRGPSYLTLKSFLTKQIKRVANIIKYKNYSF